MASPARSPGVIARASASMGAGRGGERSAGKLASRCGADLAAGSLPVRSSVDAARAFAEAAPGTVAFAVEDANGAVRGLDPDLQFSSASVSKALLLAAELRRLARGDEPLDEGTRSLLDSMITYSDNDVGQRRLRAGRGLGHGGGRGRGRDGELRGDAGVLGRRAGDGGRPGAVLLRPRPQPAGPLPRLRQAAAGEHDSSQRWGIPAGAGDDWRVYFKGGWRPYETSETSGPVTHQAALLVHRSRAADRDRGSQRPVAGHDSYGTLEGITTRLLARPSRRRWPAPWSAR